MGKVEPAWKGLFFFVGGSLAFHKGDLSVSVLMSVAGPNPWDIWGQLFMPVIGKRL